ncbi:prolyl oligopeptidase family serine peptidase [Luteolibacter sp. LG18]|uniref:prolyl oligopeptidase family serine peptidase n=1 Tax=Luteolibacter sp. LG18 TaxID=2819286 RepID=UPI002B29E2D3|nr:prolyl endopeptidase [Luteolibacter sp. LG18]
MKIPSPLVCLSALTCLTHAASAYPAARKENVTDDYHGTKVADPYRWLEDDNAADTKAWVQEENKVTRDFLAAIPRRESIRERLRTLWNYERIGAPTEYGGKWFFSRNSGLQNQAVLMVADSPEAEGKVLLDPNTLSKDGTVSLAGQSPSEDGKLLAYSLSAGGSDWQEIRVRDVATGKDLEDHLKWVKFSGVSWKKDGSGFFYSRYDAPKEGAALTQKNEFQKLCFHKIGTPQAQDPIVYERKDHANWGIHGGVTEDGRYLVIGISQGTDPKNRVFFKEIADNAKVVELLPDADAEYDFIDNDGPVFFFKTDLDAPRGRVIAIDTREPARANWKQVIPESKDLLKGVSSVGGQLVCQYLQDAKSAVKCVGFDGKLIRELALPGLGSAGGFAGKKEAKQTFYGFSTFTEPGSIYRLDLATGESKLWRKPKVGFDSDAYESEQVFYPSKDGTKVPMFIVHKKGLKLDGSNPTLLYGYGGFDTSLTPGFSIPRAVWLEMGGVLAVANLRGGGEYGREWHEAGTKLRKQNVFDDFIAAGEWLISHQYTSTPKLAIQGGSNGGLLVGACLAQRPDLFGAALPHVGVMDMLRFHKFTIGWAWQSDYGSSDNADEFKALYAYSPYHNLKSGTRYPATLVMTADHDDRVVPAHSFKFAARLQESQAQDGPPVLIRIETSAGHGAGTALNKSIEQSADEWAFLTKALDMKKD